MKNPSVLLVRAGIVAVALVLSWNAGIYLARNAEPAKISRAGAQAGLAGEAEVTATQLAENSSAVRFLEAKSCALCHSSSDQATAMRDANNRPIAPYDLWQTLMMANSARDPYWRAVLSAEVVATPSQKALIEEKCTRCHAPMAAPAPESPPSEVLAHLKAGDQRSLHGLDGVSCTVCHQITDQGLGTDASFTGHFIIGADSKIFGPHADPFVMPIQNHVGYTPTRGSHILKSALCATCHTVITDAFDTSGAPVASEFHEQSPYLEWRNSFFNDEVTSPDPRAQSCQACHMPTLDVDGNTIATRLAHNPGGRDFPFLKPRSPFGKHTFPGANTLMKQILRDNSAELEVAATPEAFDQSIADAQQFLKTRTATIELKPESAVWNKLTVRATVRNLGGHKLPTAYPSRRVWIKLTVTDSDGKTVFSSGTYNAAGELTDGQGEVLASELAGGPLNVHREIISGPEQVQVYETIMADAVGDPTFVLLRGAGYFKDNRLLPEGWNPKHADGPSTRPYGIGDDSDFVGGSDSVVYGIPLSQPGQYVVTAQLMFQSIAPRYANELFGIRTPEVIAFQRMFDAADRAPDELATATLSVAAGN